MIHRMKELTIQSINDTNTEEDRMALQMEFDAIQSEIDRVTGTTQFNTRNIFSEHLPDYYQMEGNVHWNQGSTHAVYIPDNELIIEYKLSEGEPSKTAAVTVPEGIYTTQELIDEIAMQIEDMGADEDGLNVEYTKDGTCNVNLEGGNKIETVSGGLSYLLYDMYTGGSVGALVGTTVFQNDYVELDIVSGKNDELKFEITDFSGNVSSKSITIPAGSYTRPQIIDFLNGQLSGTGVEAVRFSTGIKLRSDTAIISGFKGNMFKIDGGRPVYNSVFYDNIMYGSVSKTSAKFTGGEVLHNESRDEENNHYTIDSSNDTLKITANGGSEISLQIPAGEYSITQMVSKLNELFTANGVGAAASFYSKNGFLGLEITSTQRGLESTIEFDTTTQAYKTLFVECDYRNFSTNASVYHDNMTNRAATYTAGKDFTTSSGTLPLTITAGSNDKINLKLTDNSGNESAYQITLDAGTYNSLSDIVTQLDKQFNGTGALAGYKDMVQVSTRGSKLYLTGKNGVDLKRIQVGEISGNTGYKDLFVGKETVVSTSTASGTGTITTNTPLTDPVNITNSNRSFVVKINGVERTVNLTTGNRTLDDIKTEMDTKLAGNTSETYFTFSDIHRTGSQTYNNINKSGSGSTSHTTRYYSNTGSSEKNEGIVGAFENNTPAKVTTTVAVPETTKIDSSNNNIVMKINGVNHMINLSAGTYTRTGLVAELQRQIDASCGTEFGGATVSLSSGNALEFTARLHQSGVEMDGKKTNISFDTENSSFIRELHTTRRAAAITTPPISEPVTIDSGHNVFSFMCNTGSGMTPINLTLSNGTYNRAELVNELNRQLQANSVDVTASYNNGITLTTNGKGDGYKITFQRTSTDGGSACDAIFGDYITEYPARGSTDTNIQSSIEIDDASNEFKIRVNGEMKTVTLDNGTYDRTGFVNMLNSKLNGVGMKATLDGNKLRYETIDKGTGASFSMSYENGGISMKKIYGKSVQTTPGATADFDASGRLTLIADNPSHSISISSGNGGIFQTSNTTVNDIPPTYSDGYTSNRHSYVDGVNITEPLTIDRWNKNLTFNYNHEGVTSPINVNLEEKTYSFSELAIELQNKLDAAAGSGQFNVTVGGNGVRIECTKTGNAYSLSGFKGGFYNTVLCSSSEVHTTRGTAYTAGNQMMNDAYAIGRKNIRSGTVEIHDGINDLFSFDLKAGNRNYTFNMIISPGTYTGADFCSELQERLNEQLRTAGLQENLIKCSIGGVNSGVVGANDDNALCLIMASGVSAPEVGEYIIDGVRGSAAFHTFYQSDGMMEPAYAYGSKDISGGVEINSENNTLSFDADGVGYSITLDEREYTADELISEINSKLRTVSAPVKARMDNNKVKLEYASYGEHIIDKIGGSARESIFYPERQGIAEKRDLNIQLSSQAGVDYMTINLTELNTSFLGINSVVITKPRYAQRALDRLDEALAKVSDVRSQFGADQNRLEYAVKNRENTSENTQAAESKVRDADMAKESVELAKNSIIAQVGEAMMAQANSLREGVLRLLQ